MSGIAVIFNRDGAPVAPDQLKAMTDAMATRAVDGVRHVIEGPIGIGFCSMVTTPEAVLEKQPFRQGPLLIAFDGRLDNRRNLYAALGPAARKGAGDAELVAAAVERWGDRFVNHIIGDFAIVVADLKRRRLLCVRDHLGVKPLYYASCRDVFVAASQVAAVSMHPAVPRDLDPNALESILEHWIIPHGTIYRAICRLPMASILAVTGSEIPARYWTPSCEPFRGRNPESLVEEYRWLVREATQDRLRSAGPVVVAMSGGLDSTSVAWTAKDLRDSHPGTPEVRLASLVFPGYPLIDESDLISVMERSLDAPLRRVRTSPRSPTELSAEIGSYRELPDVPNDSFSFLVRPDLNERVLLTGLGGDDWFYARPGLEVTLAVRHFRLLKALSAARRGRATGAYSSVARALWWSGVRPLVWLPGTVAGRSPPVSAIVNRCGGHLGRRILDGGFCPVGVPLDTAPLLAWSQNALLGSQLAALERRASQNGFEERHPLHDIRLVQLSLQLPAQLRSLDADSRWLPRRAMAGRLPDPVRLRRMKAEFSLLVREELELASDRGVLHEAIAAADAPSETSARWRDIQATSPDAWHPRLFGLWSLLVVHLSRVHELHAASRSTS